MMLSIVARTATDKLKIKRSMARLFQAYIYSVIDAQEHLVKGYTLNKRRLEKNLDEFEQAVGLVKQTWHTKALEGDEVNRGTRS